MLNVSVPVILASRSPRRREHLAKLVSDFRVITEETDEALDPSIPLRDGVRMLAERKGRAVIAAHPDDCANALVIAADTLVDLGGKALGKPKDAADAARMLRSLCGTTHFVHTGAAVFYHGKCLSETDTSAVTFRDCTEEEILAYVATGEPRDKAGAYAIQGMGGTLVSHYEGEFDTIVGFPSRLIRRLCEDVLRDENENA